VHRARFFAVAAPALWLIAPLPALALWLIAPPAALAQNTRPLMVSAGNVLLLDPSGKILFAKNADESHAPASLVKMMTLYLALEDIQSGQAQWDELVTVSHHAAATPRYRMGLRPGEQVPLRVLLDGVGIASANDAATAVAEHLADGDEYAFVARMNAKAEELRLVHTRFANPHGLPDPYQRSTARDLAELISRLVHDHPASRAILGGQSFVHRGRIFTRRIPLFDDPGGVEALKTGFTREAGYNLAVTTLKAGQKFFMIVLGAQTRGLSFRDARKILHYGFVEAGLERPSAPAAKAPARKAMRGPLRVRKARP
jgi:D-alanyl-D-alanine carboxypeptidase